MADADGLTLAFRQQGAWSETQAPLYRRISAFIAERPELVDLLRSAPREQQLPVLLLAVIHDLLLIDPLQELAQYYPNLTASPRSDGLEAVLLAFCSRHASEIRNLVATKRTQTNEVGRCSLFLPALALLADELGPLAHIDVGTSAGLNLHLEQFHYEYEPGGAAGGPSTVLLTCGTRGDVPVPASIPRFSSHVGLDSHPIDVHDDEAARWLMACVWPDQVGRFARLEAAIAIARNTATTIVRGDAVSDLRSTIELAAPTSAASNDPAMSGHPVVTNSWVLNYLDTDSQRAYLETLDRIGEDRDLSWVYAEAPALVPGIATSHLGGGLSDEQITVLTMVRWRDGERHVRRLGTAHPHGTWLHWGE